MAYFDVVKENLFNVISEMNSRLSSEKDGIVKKDLIEKKKIFMNSVYWLGEIERIDICEKKIQDCIEIPDIGFCDLRLVLDPETDNPGSWVKYKIDGKEILLGSSDIILKLSSRFGS